MSRYKFICCGKETDVAGTDMMISHVHECADGAPSIGIANMVSLGAVPEASEEPAGEAPSIDVHEDAPASTELPHEEPEAPSDAPAAEVEAPK
jgi:hypothetical protein